MSQPAIAALQSVLSPHFALGNSRLETLCLIVIGMISARTVNLSHLACERPGEVQVASTYRRLQRFFQYVRLPEDWAAPLIGAMLKGARNWDLALDRTIAFCAKSNSFQTANAFATQTLSRGSE